MRFTLTVPNEPPRHYPYRRLALAYIARRQARGTLQEDATLTDTRTGTVMHYQAPEKAESDNGLFFGS